MNRDLVSAEYNSHSRNRSMYKWYWQKLGLLQLHTDVGLFGSKNLNFLSPFRFITDLCHLLVPWWIPNFPVQNQALPFVANIRSDKSLIDHRCNVTDKTSTYVFLFIWLWKPLESCFSLHWRTILSFVVQTLSVSDVPLGSSVADETFIAGSSITETMMVSIIPSGRTIGKVDVSYVHEILISKTFSTRSEKPRYPTACRCPPHCVKIKLVRNPRGKFP